MWPVTWRSLETLLDMIKPFKRLRESIEPDGQIGIQFETTRTESTGEGRSRTEVFNSFLIVPPGTDVDNAVYDHLVDIGWIYE